MSDAVFEITNATQDPNNGTLEGDLNYGDGLLGNNVTVAQNVSAIGLASGYPTGFLITPPGIHVLPGVGLLDFLASIGAGVGAGGFISGPNGIGGRINSWDSMSDVTRAGLKSLTAEVPMDTIPNDLSGQQPGGPDGGPDG